MKRSPSVAPCPVVPIIVIADSCVAITESPATHHGRLRLARKYPSIAFVPRDIRSPYQTMYVRYATTMTQLSGFIRSDEIVALQQPEEQQRHDLHGHDANEIPPEQASGLVALLIGHRAAVFFLLGAG